MVANYNTPIGITWLTKPKMSMFFYFYLFDYT